MHFFLDNEHTETTLANGDTDPNRLSRSADELELGTLPDLQVRGGEGRGGVRWAGWGRGRGRVGKGQGRGLDRGRGRGLDRGGSGGAGQLGI